MMAGAIEEPDPADTRKSISQIHESLLELCDKVSGENSAYFSTANEQIDVLRFKYLPNLDEWYRETFVPAIRRYHFGSENAEIVENHPTNHRQEPQSSNNIGENIGRKCRKIARKYKKISENFAKQIVRITLARDDDADADDEPEFVVFDDNESGGESSANDDDDKDATNIILDSVAQTFSSKAFDAINRAIRHLPRGDSHDLSVCFYLRARLHRQRSHFVRRNLAAEDNFEIDQSKDSADIRHLEAAIRDFRFAIHANPRSFTCVYSLAKTLIELDRGAEARRFLSEKIFAGNFSPIKMDYLRKMLIDLNRTIGLDDDDDAADAYQPDDDGKNAKKLDENDKRDTDDENLHEILLDHRVEMRRNPYNRRLYFCATEPIEPDARLILEQPATYTLKRSGLETYCNACGAKCRDSFYPCRACSDVVFCSIRCEHFSAAKSLRHRGECGFVSLMQNEIGTKASQVFREILDYDRDFHRDDYCGDNDNEEEEEEDDDEDDYHYDQNDDDLKSPKQQEKGEKFKRKSGLAYMVSAHRRIVSYSPDNYFPAIKRANSNGIVRFDRRQISRWFRAAQIDARRLVERRLPLRAAAELAAAIFLIALYRYQWECGKLARKNPADNRFQDTADDDDDDDDEDQNSGAFFTLKSDEELSQAISIIATELAKVTLTEFGWHDFDETSISSGSGASGSSANKRSIASFQCLIASNINHSCEFNAKWDFIDGRRLVLCASQPIAAGEQISITYGSIRSKPFVRRQKHIRCFTSVCCVCARCVRDVRHLPLAFRCDNCANILTATEDGHVEDQDGDEENSNSNSNNNNNNNCSTGSTGLGSLVAPAAAAAAIPYDRKDLPSDSLSCMRCEMPWSYGARGSSRAEEIAQQFSTAKRLISFQRMMQQTSAALNTANNVGLDQDFDFKNSTSNNIVDNGEEDENRDAEINLAQLSKRMDRLAGFVYPHNVQWRRMVASLCELFLARNWYAQAVDWFQWMVDRFGIFLCATTTDDDNDELIQQKRGRRSSSSTSSRLSSSLNQPSILLERFLLINRWIDAYQAYLDDMINGETTGARSIRINRGNRIEEEEEEDNGEISSATTVMMINEQNRSRNLDQHEEEDDDENETTRLLLESFSRYIEIGEALLRRASHTLIEIEHCNGGIDYLLCSAIAANTTSTTSAANFAIDQRSIIYSFAQMLRTKVAKFEKICHRKFAKIFDSDFKLMLQNLDSKNDAKDRQIMTESMAASMVTPTTTTTTTTTEDELEFAATIDEDMKPDSAAREDETARLLLALNRIEKPSPLSLIVTTPSNLDDNSDEHDNNNNNNNCNPMTTNDQYYEEEEEEEEDSDDYDEID